MNKKELINVVAEMVGGTKKQAGEYVDATFTAISNALAKKETVDIAKFGKFGTKERAARTARNPMTGEAVEVGAKTVPTFKYSSTVKSSLV